MFGVFAHEVDELFSGFSGSRFLSASDLQHSSEFIVIAAEKNLTEPVERMETGSHVIMRRLGSLSLACSAMRNGAPDQELRDQRSLENQSQSDVGRKWVKTPARGPLHRDHFDASLDQNNRRRSERGEEGKAIGAQIR